MVSRLVLLNKFYIVLICNEIPIQLSSEFFNNEKQASRKALKVKLFYRFGLFHCVVSFLYIILVFRNEPRLVVSSSGRFVHARPGYLQADDSLKSDTHESSLKSFQMSVNKTLEQENNEMHFYVRNRDEPTTTIN